MKHIDALISADYGNNELQNQFMSRLQELDDRSKKEENISQGIPDVNLTGFELTDYDLIKTYEQFLSEGYEAPVEHNKLSKQLVAIWTYYNFLWGAEDEIPLTVAFYLQLLPVHFTLVFFMVSPEYYADGETFQIYFLWLTELAI